MILNRDCFFYKKSDFINRLPDISEESICYIADTQQIYVQGRYFECNVTRDIVEQLIQSKGYLTPSDLPVLTGGAAPTSGEFVSGVSVGGHTVNVQKGKFSEINAGTASKLETPREIALSGDASGSIEFDGSQDVVIETTVHHSTTADRLTTPRTISLDDQATGQVSFDGSGDVIIPVTINQLDSKNANNNDLNDLVTLNGYVGNLFYGGGGNTSENKPDGVDSFGLLTFKSAAGNYSTQILGSSNRLYTRSGADSSLGSWRTVAYLTDNVASATKLRNTRTFTISDGTHSGTSSNFDGTDNVTLKLPKTINADINGDITGDIVGNVTGNVTGDLYGNADTASKLENSVDISLSGDVSGTVSFDGSANVTIPVTVANNSHTHTIANISGLQSALDGKQAAGNYMTTDTAQSITGAKTSIANPWSVRMNVDTSNAVAGLIWKNTSGTPIAGLTYHNVAKRIFITANSPEVTDIWSDAAGKYSLRIGWNELTYNNYPILRSDNWSSYVTWSNLPGKPSSFTPASHNHSASNITSGTLGVARGGTGITSNPSMLVNLASTTADTVFEASPRPGITGILGIAHGGTGASSASAARTALGITPANIGAAATEHSHDISDITNIHVVDALPDSPVAGDLYFIY